MQRGVDALHRAEGIELPLDAGEGLITSTMFRDPTTGRLLSPEEAFGPDGADLASYEVVPFGLPGERVGLVVARESAIEIVIGLVTVGGVTLVVAGRRPM